MAVHSALHACLFRLQRSIILVHPRVRVRVRVRSCRCAHPFLYVCGSNFMIFVFVFCFVWYLYVVIISSSELWDASLGQWLSRCRSQPFDVHAAWLPDGKHFVAGLDLDWDQRCARRRSGKAPRNNCA